MTLLGAQAHTQAPAAVGSPTPDSRNTRHLYCNRLSTGLMVVCQPYRIERHNPIPIFSEWLERCCDHSSPSPPRVPSSSLSFPFSLPMGDVYPKELFYALWTTDGWTKLRAKPLQGLRSSYPGASGGRGEGGGREGGGGVGGAGDGASSR